MELEKAMVTIPLTEYTRLVKLVAELEHERVLDDMQRQLDDAKDERTKALCRMYEAEAKLKEMKEAHGA